VGRGTCLGAAFVDRQPPLRDRWRRRQTSSAVDCLGDVIDDGEPRTSSRAGANRDQWPWRRGRPRV